MDGEQERLFRLAMEAITFQAHYRPGEGWTVRVRARRGDETWEQSREGVYSHLNAAELATAVACELETALGL